MAEQNAAAGCPVDSIHQSLEYAHASAQPIPLPTCQRPTLHVRNTYDVPHTGHLIAVSALGLAAILARDPALTPILAAAAIAWLALWGSHALANAISAGQPFRCQSCGSTAATPTAVADATEGQRLQAALAKAAARRAGE